MKSSLAQKTIPSGCLTDRPHPLFSQTFSCNGHQLPTIAEIKKHIYTDRDWIKAGTFDPQKHLLTTHFRESYVGQSFVLLCDEFLLTLKQLCTDINTIAELGSGIGWLSHWLQQYGINIKATIDNKSWSEFPQKRYLHIVQQMNSLTYTKQHPDVDLFILSWPQEDDTATQIWKTLRSGQYLLYIGESDGGCTADNSFFKATKGCEVNNSITKKMKKSFLSFDDFHDQPYLYQKP